MSWVFRSEKKAHTLGFRGKHINFFVRLTGQKCPRVNRTLTSGTLKPVQPKAGHPNCPFWLFQCFWSMLLSAPKLDSPIGLQVDREPQPAPASHPTWVSSAHRETEHKRNRRKFRRNFRRNSDGIRTEFRRNEKRKKRNFHMSENTQIPCVFFLCAMVRGGDGGTSERYWSWTPVRPWCT